MDRDAQILRVASYFLIPVSDVNIFIEGCLGYILVPTEPEVTIWLHASISNEYERSVLVGQIQIVHEQICRLE